MLPEFAVALANVEQKSRQAQRFIGLAVVGEGLFKLTQVVGRFTLVKENFGFFFWALGGQRGLYHEPEQQQSAKAFQSSVHVGLMALLRFRVPDSKYPIMYYN
jgi:hypothetical protein